MRPKVGVELWVQTQHRPRRSLTSPLRLAATTPRYLGSMTARPTLDWPYPVLVRYTHPNTDLYPSGVATLHASNAQTESAGSLSVLHCDDIAIPWERVVTVERR